MSIRKKIAIGLLIFQGLSLFGTILGEGGLYIPNIAYFIGLFIPTIISLILFYIDSKQQNSTTNNQQNEPTNNRINQIESKNHSLKYSIEQFFLTNYKNIINSNIEYLNKNIYTKLDYLIFLYYQTKNSLFNATQDNLLADYYTNIFIQTIDSSILQNSDKLSISFTDMLKNRLDKFNNTNLDIKDNFDILTNLIINDYNNEPFCDYLHIISINEQLELYKLLSKFYINSLNNIMLSQKNIINSYKKYGAPQIKPIIEQSHITLNDKKTTKNIVDDFLIKLALITGIPKNKMDIKKVLTEYSNLILNTPENENLDLSSIYEILKKENKFKEVSILSYTTESDEMQYFDKFIKDTTDELSNLVNLKYSNSELNSIKVYIAKYIDKFVNYDLNENDSLVFSLIQMSFLIKNKRSLSYLNKNYSKQELNMLTTSSEQFLKNLDDCLNNKLSINSKYFSQSVDIFEQLINTLWEL